MLYVADTENHCHSRDRSWQAVGSTIAGTGEQLQRRVTFGGQAKDTSLNSPWDLTMQNAFSTSRWPSSPVVANESEDRRHSALRRKRARGSNRWLLAEAALAQPSGITSDGKKLYFADSEVSSIRSADLDPNGRVDTIVGEDLFEFGDRDGKGPAVRLQHPLGVVYSDGSLYVADTYNNKIKRVSPKDRTSETFVGTARMECRTAIALRSTSRASERGVWQALRRRHK